MSDPLEKLIVLLETSSITSNISKEIIDLLETQIQTVSPSFIKDSLRLLTILERWSWQYLADKSHSGLFDELLHTLASFNKVLIGHCDEIEIETKASLILPEQIDQITSIFNSIEHCNDDHSSWLILINLWFDNVSLLSLEYPQLAFQSLIGHINHHVAENFILTDDFQSTLKCLISVNSSTIELTPRTLFYLKTCLYSLHSYIYSKPIDILPMMKQIFRKYGHDYVKIICLQTFNIEKWTKDLLACLAQCINGICACASWSEENDDMMNFIFPTETSLDEFAQALIRIIAYQPLYDELKFQRMNMTTILFDVTLFCLTNLIDRGNLRWFLRLLDDFPTILLTFIESTKCARFTFYSYGIFGELLPEEKLKELRFTENMAVFYFDMLEQAWKQPSRIYKQISVRSLLRSHLSLSKNAFTTQATADMNKLPLIIELCNEYPSAYDLIWTLSFNTDIQQQLRTQTSFIEKISHLSNTSNERSIRKVCSGILWNLNSHKDDRLNESSKQKDTFDIMISYSHKDKELCHRLYNELIKRGFRVWIDFDQMHGNVMDAMAQAIEQSQMVIICMSEEYRRSNFCRAEAQYAFQRQRRMTPVLLQKHYKPDGWLSFLLGQLLYVDFTKHEFTKAMEMLLKELDSHNNQAPLMSTSVLIAVTKEKEEKRQMREWTKNELHQWFIENGLLQMSRLLIDYDGRSIFYLHRFLRNGDKNDMIKLLNEDVKHRLTESLSVVELCRLLALIDHNYYLCNRTSSGQK